MADEDVLQARRERRRRKILENAEKRMATFRNESKFHSELPSDASAQKRPDLIEFPTCTSSCDDPVHLNAEDEVETQLAEEAEHYHDEHAQYPELDEAELFGGLQEDRKLQAQENRSVNLRKKLIFVLGCLIRYINLVLENSVEIMGIDVEYWHVNMIFVPFLIYEITEFVVYRPEPEESPALALVIKLNHLHGRGIEVAVAAMSHVLRLLKDMAIYFFAYVFMDMVFAVFKVDDEVV